MKIQKEKIILGIDPGTTIMGFGLIKVVGNKMSLLLLNELILNKLDDHYLRLKHMYFLDFQVFNNIEIKYFNDYSFGS